MLHHDWGTCLTSARTRVSRVLCNVGDDIILSVAVSSSDLDPEEDLCPSS